jgi:hypothetical protein
MTTLGLRKVNRTGRSTGQRKTNRHTALEQQLARGAIRRLRSRVRGALSLSGRLKLYVLQFLKFLMPGPCSFKETAVTR